MFDEQVVMIAKHILRKSGNGKFRALGRYIADANHQGEKCLMFWHKGCVSLSEDYDLAIAEIEATQAMNTRAKTDKTYHLMISFHPEDEPKLKPEVFQQIESAMADALGVSKHQRVCGVHKNTNNLHMHIAYNLIHPEHFTKERTFRDFYKLASVCRDMEERFGLVVDPGVESEPGKRLNQRASAMEAHSGEQSFQSFVMSYREQIIKGVETAATWKEVHKTLAECGLEIKKRGNGLVLVNLRGKETMKASTLDRSLSKTRLTKRFGPYIQSEVAAKPLTSYTRQPLHPRSPERDQLYKEYQAAIKEKIARIDGEKARHQMKLTKLHQRWGLAKQTLVQKTFSRKTLFTRLNLLRDRKAEILIPAMIEHRERMIAIKKEYPWYNWNGYLKWQAERGNKSALEVLRSRQKTPQNEFCTNPDDYHLARERASLVMARRKSNIMQSGSTIGQRKIVTATNRMALLAAQENLRIKAGLAKTTFFTGYQQTIDNRGVVIFTLPHGGTIRDTGPKIHFSTDGITQKAARCYALAKFGKAWVKNGNTIKRKEYGEQSRRTIDKSYFSLLKKSARDGLRTLSQLPLAFGGNRTEMFLSDHARSDVER